uniref:Uncharacterized protein n=1 Tax=Oryza rufipogon TaxID=4529 RepID=A0A0E0NCI9_ORYRU
MRSLLLPLFGDTLPPPTSSLIYQRPPQRRIRLSRGEEDPPNRRMRFSY